MALVAADVAYERSLRSGAASAKVVAGAAVPVIDLAAAPAVVAAQLWDAARTVGFFTVVNHGVDAQVIERGFAASEKFFSMPLDAKRASSPFEPKQNAGYEFMEQVRPSTGLADHKESLQVTARFGAMDGRWPSNALEADAKALLEASHLLGCKLLSLLEPRACPSLSPGTLAKAHNLWAEDGQCTLRLLHYPPMAAVKRAALGDSDWRAGAHTDWCNVTLLFQREGDDGLECAAHGTDGWAAVAPVAGGISVNIGDMLSRWSDGRLLSNLHRVRLPTVAECGRSPPRGRHSMAVFLQADKGTLIRSETQPPITAGAYILGRILSNFAPTGGSKSALDAYCVLWCVQNVSALTCEGRPALGDAAAFDVAVVCVALVASLWAIGDADRRKRRAAVFIAAVLVRCFSQFEKIPMVWDCSYWELQTDSVLLVSLIATLLLSEEAAIAAEAACMRTISVQLAYFYTGAGFWKINTSFLDPAYSCASIFFVQLVAGYLPFAPGLAPFAAQIAPMATVGIEMAAGLSLLVCNAKWARLGAALALLLHLMINITPEPNNIAAFSLICATRLAVFAAPDALADLASESANAVSNAPLKAAAAVVFLACAAGSSSAEALKPMDWAFIGYGAVSMPVLFALARADSPAPAPKARVWHRGVHYFFVALAAFYAFGPPMLGVLEVGQTNMYANLQQHGGANHLLLPTGLLHKYYKDDATSAFFGGECRVEATNSKVVRWFYPTEITSTLQPPSVHALLAASGAPTRFFNAAKVRVLGFSGVQGAPPFTKFSVPAIELRRLLSEAKAGGEAFDLEYSRVLLHDEDEETTPKVRVSFDASGKLLSCAVRATKSAEEEACASNEIALLPPPPKWALKHLIYIPLPVIDNSDHKLTCFGP